MFWHWEPQTDGELRLAEARRYDQQVERWYRWFRFMERHPLVGRLTPKRFM
jgi:hypothetical protein